MPSVELPVHPPRQPAGHLLGMCEQLHLGMGVPAQAAVPAPGWGGARSLERQAATNRHLRGEHCLTSWVNDLRRARRTSADEVRGRRACVDERARAARALRATLALPGPLLPS